MGPPSGLEQRDWRRPTWAGAGCLRRLEHADPNPSSLRVKEGRCLASWGTSCLSGSGAQIGAEVPTSEPVGSYLGAAERGERREEVPDVNQQSDDVGEGTLDVTIHMTAVVGRPIGGDIGTRASRRLAAMEAPSILAKAVARKARREDLESDGGMRRALRNRKKIKNKGVLCGVLLDDREANSFLEFVARNE